MKKSKFVAKLEPVAIKVVPSIKANLNYQNATLKQGAHYDIGFSYEDEEQVAAMKQKYNLNEGNGEYAFYSYDNDRIDGVKIYREDVLRNKIAEFVNNQIDVTIGGSTVGGKYDEDVRTVVEKNLAEIKAAQNSVREM